jgi:hypothetical protein
MGTIGDWGVILTISVFVGLYGWLRDMGHKPYINKLRRSLAGWILASSVVGIWCTFRWRAFRVPLVFITVPVAVAAAVLIYSARPRGGQLDAEEPFAEKHNPRSHPLGHH